MAPRLGTDIGRARIGAPPLDGAGGATRGAGALLSPAANDVPTSVAPPRDCHPTRLCRHAAADAAAESAASIQREAEGPATLAGEGAAPGAALCLRSLDPRSGGRRAAGVRP